MWLTLELKTFTKDKPIFHLFNVEEFETPTFGIWATNYISTAAISTKAVLTVVAARETQTPDMVGRKYRAINPLKATGKLEGAGFSSPSSFIAKKITKQQDAIIAFQEVFDGM